jgi:hypothetical protein
VTGFSVTVATSAEYDDIAAIWALVRGTAADAPYDPHSGLPAVEEGGPPAEVVFSTTKADDLLYYVTAGDNGLWLQPPPQQVTPSSWIWQQGVGNTGGFGAIAIAMFTRTATVPQSGATAGTVTPVSGGAVFFVDAFTANT